MSWSVTASGDDKAAIKEKINSDPMVPASVKSSITSMIDACPDGKKLDVSTYGHHNQEELANASIAINVS